MSGHNKTSAAAGVLARQTIANLTGGTTDAIGYIERDWAEIEYPVELSASVHTWVVGHDAMLSQRVGSLELANPSEILRTKGYAFQYEFKKVTVEACLFFEDPKTWEDYLKQSQFVWPFSRRPMLFCIVNVLEPTPAARHKSRYSKAVLRGVLNDTNYAYHPRQLPIFNSAVFGTSWESVVGRLIVRQENEIQFGNQTWFRNRFLKKFLA